MRKARFKETDIVRVHKEVEGGCQVKEVFREYGISDATYYNWKAKYGCMEIADISKLKELADENRRLKQKYADLSLKHEALKWVFVVGLLIVLSYFLYWGVISYVDDEFPRDGLSLDWMGKNWSFAETVSKSAEQQNRLSIKHLWKPALVAVALALLQYRALSGEPRQPGAGGCLYGPGSDDSESKEMNQTAIDREAASAILPTESRLTINQMNRMSLVNQAAWSPESPDNKDAGVGSKLHFRHFQELPLCKL
jgi:putative transposase